MSLAVEAVTHEDLMALVDERRDEVRAFVDWAEDEETGGLSMYLVNRPDVCDAREAAALYPEAWWGVVVFTCFGSLNSTRAIRDVFARPVDAQTAEGLLAAVEFTKPKVGHHRIQQGLVGAKKALIAACDRSDFLQEVLHTRSSFDDRYQRLLSAGLARWARTTCFDLLLRAGALGIGGQYYGPEIAYLAGSTGPKAGFHAVWGRHVTAGTAAWCEGLLQAWHRHWAEVVDRVGARWSSSQYAPGDLENALCIYQERADVKAG
jgi:hypothetical protein